MDVPRSVTSLGLLLLVVSLFLAWFPNGTDISGLYITNGQFNTATLTSSSNVAITVTFLLFPLSLLIALWASWKRRISPWQALALVPSLAWIFNQIQHTTTVTYGPILGLVGGTVLTVGYVTNIWGIRRSGYAPRGNNPGYDSRQRNKWRGGGGRGYYRRRGNLKLLAGLWILLVGVGIYLGGAYLWFPAYYWFFPGLTAFVIGIFGGLRIWRYAMSAGDVRSAWTTRMVMTLGLFGTGFLMFVLFVSTTMADVTLYTSTQYTLHPSAANAAANTGTGFMMSLIAFIVPSFFAFGAGEAYLLYRLRHHYTVSGF